MSIEANKRIARQYFDLFGRSAVADILAMMTDDATWWVNGKPHLFSGAGTKTKAEMARLWPALYASLPGGLQMSVVGMIAEGD